MSDGACDFADEPHGRNWILTRLSPPVSVELCDEHLAPGMIGLLAADLGVEYGDLYGAIEKFLAREAKKAEKDLAAAQEAAQAEGNVGDGSNLEDTGPYVGPDEQQQRLIDAAAQLAEGHES